MSDFKELKETVLAANQELPRRGIVIYSWGNVSAIDRGRGVLAIKPAGIAYEKLTVDSISVTDLEGNVLEGPYKPSVDLPIHLVLFKAFSGIGSIVHTHSTYATMFAQSRREIPCYGTTHADYFYGSIPCARIPSRDEVDSAFEESTGRALVEALSNRSPMDIPGALAGGHGVFAWGPDAWTAVHNAVVLEEIAHMAFGTELLAGHQKLCLPGYILDKHFQRKHGANAYFEQDDMGGP